MSMPKRAVTALERAQIGTGEALVKYICEHPGWCHADAYPNNIRGIGIGTARQVLDRLLECGLVEPAWHERQTYLTTEEGYKTLWVQISKTREKLSVKSL